MIIVFLKRLLAKLENFSKGMGGLERSMNTLIDLMAKLNGRTERLEGRVDEFFAQNNSGATTKN